MAGRKFSSRNLYNLECVLPYIRERYIFLNIFINDKNVQGSTSTSTQPEWSAKALIVFPALFCLHGFQWRFVFKFKEDSSWQSSSWPWESVLKSVFMILVFFIVLTNELFFMNPLLLAWTWTVSCWCLRGFMEALLPVGLLPGTPKVTMVAFFPVQPQ